MSVRAERCGSAGAAENVGRGIDDVRGRARGPRDTRLDRDAHHSSLGTTKNSSRLSRDHSGSVPPAVDTSHCPRATSGNGRDVHLGKRRNCSIDTPASAHPARSQRSSLRPASAPTGLAGLRGPKNSDLRAHWGDRGSSHQSFLVRPRVGSLDCRLAISSTRRTVARSIRAVARRCRFRLQPGGTDPRCLWNQDRRK